MSLADIRTRATRFQSRVRQRNALEYAASAFVIVFFTWAALTAPAPLIQLGAAMIVLGTFYVCWNLYTLARADAVDGLNEVQAWTEFHRSELKRQRSALDTVWRWYLAPFAPGMVVFIAGVAFTPETPMPVLARAIVFGLGVGMIGAMFAGIAWLNKRAVKALDREIAALDEMRSA